MVLSMMPEDMKKLRELQAPKKTIKPRKNRTALLSAETKKKELKRFEQSSSLAGVSPDIKVDEHMKMDDSYMRTGVYIAKKK